MNINQRHSLNINDKKKLYPNKKIKQREIELETEIPIWFNGRVKWISNLTSRSRCSDVIEAILTSLDSPLSNENNSYILYESWRGVERALKDRCRLLKLWNSWAGESSNVILTLRLQEDQRIAQHILIQQQGKKLNQLKSEIKKSEEFISKRHVSNLENDHDRILNYLNTSRSIVRLNTEIENQKQFILNLRLKIDNESKEDYFLNDFKEILFDVNQTLISSRKLTIISDQFEQDIQRINEDIEQKQILLDELELDWALQDNIPMDSLEDQSNQTFSFKQYSTSPTPMKTSTVLNRPTAIVEPSLSTFKSKEYFSENDISPFKKIPLQEKLSTKTNLEFLPFSISSNCHNQLSNNDQSNPTMSSIHSNEEQLVTLV